MTSTSTTDFEWNKTLSRSFLSDRKVIDLDDELGFADIVKSLRRQISTLHITLESLAAAHDKELKHVEIRSPKKHINADSRSSTRTLELAVARSSRGQPSSQTPDEELSTAFHSINEHSHGLETSIRPSLNESYENGAFQAQARTFTRGKDAAVKELIESSWDPNYVFQNVSLNHKVFLHITPLVCAALRNRIDLVQWLVEKKADPDSTYSFTAGALGVTWSGACSHAALPSGNMTLLKKLFELLADVNTRGSNGANLLWQAAYFNQKGLAEYLLEERCDIETRAVSQDRSSATHTPLHAAAYHGNAALVSLLLCKKAAVNVYDSESSIEENARSVLHDTIAHGHPDVAKLLIESSADLFEVISGRTSRQSETTAVKKTLSKRGTPPDLPKGGVRLLDLVFELNNPVVVASCAEALEKTPKLLDHLSRGDLVRFINHSQGSAAYYIMNAVFRPYTIRYWEVSSGGQIARVLRRTAYLNGYHLMNVAQGPHVNFVTQSFNDKVTPTLDWQRFFNELLPEDPNDSSLDVFASVRTFMCHVPNVLDLQVLLAIADCKSDRIFDTPGCKGLLAMAATEVEIDMKAKIGMLMSVLELMDLCLLLLVLNKDWVREIFSGVVGYVATIRFLIELFGWSLTGLGYYLQGLSRRFLRRVHHIIVLLLYGGALALTWTEVRTPDPGASFSLFYRCCLGAVVFIKTMQLLLLACQFHIVGKRILPITSVFYDIGPFCVVMAFCVSSSFAMYYALQIRELVKSFMFIYTLILIGEFEMTEIEPVDFSYDPNTGAIIESVEKDNDEYFYAVMLVMVFVTFSMSLTLMNLFIAILNMSYYKAAEKAEVHFLRNRTVFVLDSHALRLSMRTLIPGWRKCMKILCPCCSRRQSDTEATGSLTIGHFASQVSGCFLWLCLPEEKN